MEAIIFKLPHLSACGKQVENNGVCAQFVVACWIQVYHQVRAALLPGVLVSQTDVNYIQKHYLLLTGYLYCQDMISRSLSCVCVSSLIERNGTQGQVEEVNTDHVFMLMFRVSHIVYI